MTESDSAVLNSVVAEEEGEGEEGSSAPASNQHTLGMQQARVSLSWREAFQSCPSIVAGSSVLLTVKGECTHVQNLTSHVSQKLPGNL